MVQTDKSVCVAMCLCCRINWIVENSIGTFAVFWLEVIVNNMKDLSGRSWPVAWTSASVSKALQRPKEHLHENHLRNSHPQRFTSCWTMCVMMNAFIERSHKALNAWLSFTNAEASSHVPTTTSAKLEIHHFYWTVKVPGPRLVSAADFTVLPPSIYRLYAIYW